MVQVRTLKMGKKAKLSIENKPEESSKNNPVKFCGKPVLQTLKPFINAKEANFSCKYRRFFTTFQGDGLRLCKML